MDLRVNIIPCNVLQHVIMNLFFLKAKYWNSMYLYNYFLAQHNSTFFIKIPLNIYYFYSYNIDSKLYWSKEIINIK